MMKKTANAVRAIGRMNALRLVSLQKKAAAKSNGSSSSEKSSSPPSSTDRSPVSPDSSPTERITNGIQSNPGSEGEKPKINKDIDRNANSTNEIPKTQRSSRDPGRKGQCKTSESNGKERGKEYSPILGSSAEDDSGLDLSLDQEISSNRNSKPRKSGQDSEFDVPNDTEPHVPANKHNKRRDNVTLKPQLTDDNREGTGGVNSDPDVVITTTATTATTEPESRINTNGDLAADNMDRYLFDPAKGVKNQAARWEVRTQSPDRGKFKQKEKAGQQQQLPQQAPVFRQKFRHCEVVSGTEARFDCRVDGNPSPDIIWYKNGKRIVENERYTIMKGEEPDLHSLLIKETCRDDQGTFMCEARSPAGKARCSARLIVQHLGLSTGDTKSSTPESTQSTPKQSSTARKFWQFGSSSKNKEPKEKSTTQTTTTSKQPLLGLSWDRKNSSRSGKDTANSSSPTSASEAPSPGTASRKSAVDALKERAEAFTQQYEKRKEERQSLADKEPRRTSVTLYLQRYNRSQSADRSSSFSVSSSSGRRASSTSTDDVVPSPRPRLATYATMIRSQQSIGALAAKFEQNKPSNTNGKAGTSTPPRKDLKYNANLDAKKALFSGASNGSSNAVTSKEKAKETVARITRSSTLQSPSTSSLRSRFESPSRGEKEKEPLSLQRSTPVRQSTGRLSYLDKVETKEENSSPFGRSSPARHSTIGVSKSPSILDRYEPQVDKKEKKSNDVNKDARHSTIGITKSSVLSRYEPQSEKKESKINDVGAKKSSSVLSRYEPQSEKKENKISDVGVTKSSSVLSRYEPQKEKKESKTNDVKRETVSPTASSIKVTSSAKKPQTYISRYETKINSDSESSVTSTSSSTSESVPRKSPSVTSRYEVKAATEKPPSFIKKPQKLTTTEGESASFSCVVDGEPKPEITWHFRGKPLVDEGRYEIYEEKGAHVLEIFDLVPRDAGLYTCRILNSAGRSSALVELVVNTKPKRPPFFLQKLSNCEVREEGAHGRLQCKLEGEPTPEVTWLKEGKLMQEGDRVHFTRNANGIFALIIDNVNDDDDAIYTCVAKNKHGQVSSSAELIVDIEPPTKTDQNSFLSDTSLHIDELDIKPDGAYSPPAAVTPPPTEPAPSAPQFIIRPNSVSVDEAKSARFTCTVSGYPTPTISWARDEKILQDEGRFEIYEDNGKFIMEIFDAVPDDSGLYTCTASNSAGKVATGAQLTVTAISKPPPVEPAPYFNSLSSTDIQSDEVFSAEDVASLKSEQIPKPEANITTTTTTTTEFEPPSRIPPEFLARPSSQTIVEPNSAKFSCQVVGDPKPSVTWSQNGVVLSDAGRFEIYEENGEYVLEIFDTTTEDTGTYVCTAANLAGQKVVEATLTVETALPKDSPPEFLQKIADATAKDGEAFTFTCKVTGIPPPTVHWFYRNQEIVGSDEVYEISQNGETATLCLPEVLPEDEGEYSCTARNSAGETTCTARLKVQVPPELKTNVDLPDSVPSGTKPEFLQKLKDTQAIDGNPLSLPVRVKGDPEPEIKWFFNGDQIKEDNDFKFVKDGDRYSLVIAEVYPDDAGLYTCEILNSAGSEECSANVFVQDGEMNGSAPKFLQKPRSINVDEGSSVKLSCKVDGDPLPSVTWIKDERAIEPGRRFKMESSGISGTTRSLHIPTVLSTDAGSYTCVLQNDHGVEKCNVTVVVKPLEEEQTDFRSLLKSRPRLQNISNSPNNMSSDRSEAEQLDFRHVLTRHVQTKKKPVFVKPLLDVEVKEGEPVTFECYVDSIPPPTISWTVNNKDIKESKYFHMSYIDNVAKLIIAEAFPEDEGEYTCTAVNPAGQASCSADLSVQEDEETWSEQKHYADEPVMVNGPTLDDTSRSEIESSCTKDKVASTFNVRLSSVFTENGTAPSVKEHNTNSNNNNEILASPPVETKVSLTRLSTEESLGDSSILSSDMDQPDQNGGVAAVAELPSFLEELKNVTVLEENSAMLKCKIAGEPEPDVHWYKNGQELQNDRKYKIDFPDDDVAVLIVKEATLDDAGEYTCKVVNSCGATEGRAEIIIETPACIKDAPRIVQVLAGNTVTASCKFVGIPQPEVTWCRYRKPIQQDDRIRVEVTKGKTTLTIQNANEVDSGRYTLLVENDLGDDETAISISILDKPDPPVGKPTASNVSRNSLTLSWTGSGYDGGSRITGYVIELRTINEGTWKKVAMVSHTSHVIEDLEPETEYLFRVSSENEYGVSDPGQISDPILMVVDQSSSEGDAKKSDSDDESAPFEYRHVTIKSDKEFLEKYSIKDVLGKGRFGTVHKCVDKVTGGVYAAKIIKMIRASEKETVKNEIAVMNKLHHPKLLQCLDAFESPKQMIMVLEIVNGGELFERVIDDDFCLTEGDVIKFMRQICAGVQHMHEQNILHLDLKPENILCVDKTGSRIKLIDFGLARCFDPKESVKVMFGTPEFVAPEVINYDAIGFTTDMWSVGVICYILLSGLSPFMGDNDAETLSNVTLAEWDFEDEAFDTISDNAKCFIEGLLIKEKEQRMSADQCLQHKWLINDTKDLKSNKISTTKLKKFVARRRWQKTATAVRAIGRMASLSLFSGLKKANEAANNGRTNSPTSPLARQKKEDGSPNFKLAARKSDITKVDENEVEKSAAKVPAVQDDVAVVESGTTSSEDTSEKRREKPETGTVNVESAPTSETVENNEHEDECSSTTGEGEEEEEEDETDGPGKDLNQNIPGAPHFIKEMVDCEVFEGDSARFDCRIAGEPEPDVKWYQDGVEIEESRRFIFDYDDDGSCSLIIRGVQEDDEAEYSIKAINRNGEATCVAELLVDAAGF